MSELIPTLWCLTGAEFHSGNISNCQTHFEALKSVVQRNGGFRALPNHLCDLLIAADMTLTQTGAIPNAAFPPDAWDPGSIVDRLTVSESIIIFDNFQIIGALNVQIPHLVYKLFRDVRELLAVYQMAQSHANASRRTSLFRWIHRRQYAIVLRIIEHRTGINASLQAHVSSPESSIEETDVDDTTQGVDTTQLNLSLAATLGLDYVLQLLWLTRMKTRSDRVPFYHPQPLLQPMVKAFVLEYTTHDTSPHELIVWLSFIAAVVELRSLPAASASAPSWPGKSAWEKESAVGEGPVGAAAYVTVDRPFEELQTSVTMRSLFLEMTLRTNLTRWEDVEGTLWGFVYDVALLRGDLQRLMRATSPSP